MSFAVAFLNLDGRSHFPVPHRLSCLKLSSLPPYLQTLFFPTLLTIHNYLWLTRQVFVFPFPSLMVLHPLSLSMYNFHVSFFPWFYIFSPLVWAMDLFNPPCFHPGYLPLYPVPSSCLLRGAELWWGGFPYVTSQLLRCLPGSLCVSPLGEPRMYVEQGEVSMSREAEVSTCVVTE